MTDTNERTGGICVDARTVMTQDGPSRVEGTPHRGPPLDDPPAGGWAPGYPLRKEPHMCNQCQCIFIPGEPGATSPIGMTATPRRDEGDEGDTVALALPGFWGVRTREGTYDIVLVADGGKIYLHGSDRPALPNRVEEFLKYLGDSKGPQE